MEAALLTGCISAILIFALVIVKEEALHARELRKDRYKGWRWRIKLGRRATLLLGGTTICSFAGMTYYNMYVNPSLKTYFWSGVVALLAFVPLRRALGLVFSNTVYNKTYDPDNSGFKYLGTLWDYAYEVPFPYSNRPLPKGWWWLVKIALYFVAWPVMVLTTTVPHIVMCQQQGYIHPEWQRGS